MRGLLTALLGTCLSLAASESDDSYTPTYNAPAGVYYSSQDTVQSSSACASVIYFRGERVGESNLYVLDSQTWDLERAVVYSPELHGCVQCAADRFLNVRDGDEFFFAPAQCPKCPPGLYQDATGTGCTAEQESCSPPMIRTGYGSCGCPPFTEMKAGNFCACADPVASTEYTDDHQVHCICPPETRLMDGQCLCPKADQVYDPDKGWCGGCPHPLVAVSESVHGWVGCRGGAPRLTSCLCLCCQDGNRCVYRHRPHVWSRCGFERDSYWSDPQHLDDYMRANLVLQGAGPEAELDVKLVQGTCDDATVTYSTHGAWGSLEKSVPVKYDPTCPTVHSSVRYNTLDWHSLLVADVGFRLDVSDLECDEHPHVTLSVYSDQNNIVSKLPTAQVQPIFDQHGHIINFQVMLRARHYFICNPDNGRLCLNKEGEGRVYLIRVCVTTEAGCESCDISEVSIPILKMAKPTLSFKTKDIKSSLFAPRMKAASLPSLDALTGATTTTATTTTPALAAGESTGAAASQVQDAVSQAQDALQNVAGGADPSSLVGAASDAAQQSLLFRSRRLQQVNETGEAETTDDGVPAKAELQQATVTAKAADDDSDDSGDGEDETEGSDDDGYDPSGEPGIWKRCIVSKGGKRVGYNPKSIQGELRRKDHRIPHHVGGGGAYYLLAHAEGKL